MARVCAAIVLASGVVGIVPAAAMGAGAPSKVVIDTLGAGASVVGQDGDLTTQSWLSFSLTNPEAGTGDLYLSVYAMAFDPDGTSRGYFGSGTGTVSGTVDQLLKTASVSGTITLSLCQASDWYCASPIERTATLDATWQGFGKEIKTNFDTIYATDKSRTIVHRNSLYRLSTPTVLLDGVSLGVSDESVMNMITDERNSSIEIYHGTQGLPGTLMTQAQLTAMTATDSQRKARNTSDYAVAMWNGETGAQETVFGADAFSTMPAEKDRFVAAFYSFNAYVPTPDGGSVHQLVQADGTGVFDFDAKLDTASFSGSLPAQSCTVTPLGDWICIEMQIDVTVIWTGTGPITTGTEHWNQAGTAGEKYVSVCKIAERNVTAVATINGQALRVSDGGYFEDIDCVGETPRG